MTAATPSESDRSLMERLLRQIPHLPNRVVPVAGGGLDAYFTATTRRFVMVTVDDGSAAVMFIDRNAQISDTDEIYEGFIDPDVVRKITDFLGWTSAARGGRG